MATNSPDHSAHDAQLYRNLVAGGMDRDHAAGVVDGRWVRRQLKRKLRREPTDRELYRALDRL
jgi:hypothetical protein